MQILPQKFFVIVLRKLHEMDQRSGFCVYTKKQVNQIEVVEFNFFRILKHSICDRMMMERQLRPWTCWFQG